MQPNEVPENTLIELKPYEYAFQEANPRDTAFFARTLRIIKMMEGVGFRVSKMLVTFTDDTSRKRNNSSTQRKK